MATLLPIVLYVEMIVSLDWPQEVPASDLRILLRWFILVAMLPAWALKVSFGSKVTPRILGVLTRGSGFPFILISGCRLI